MKVLILTSDDTCVFTNNMQAYLEKKKHETTRLNISNLVDISNYFFSKFEITSQEFCFYYRGEKRKLSEYDLVWKRRFEGNFLNNALNLRIYNKYPPSIKVYLQREVNHLAETILNYIEILGIPMINNFSEKIHNKINQLHRADFFGLKVPDFTFTNDKYFANEFINKNNQTITKPLSNFGYINDDKSIYSHRTSLLRKNEALNMSQIFFPSYFQESIKSDYELKCIYIGGELLAVKQKKKAKGDPGILDIKMEYMLNNVVLENYDVKFNIKEKTKKMCESYNIDFCTMDFLVDKDNNYTFLEINTDGIVSFYSNYIKENTYKVFYKKLVNGKIR
ncbi:hypothetical protein ABW636_07390 [Aquimarina sp. 2201CG1-2-11]|uniref:ATP-grasp domain-containing protein n=1 Tax=Aquimarina discodermiae TaxID=3231043 RepID=UPI00346250A8